jgi:hypothetical protein
MIKGDLLWAGLFNCDFDFPLKRHSTVNYSTYARAMNMVTSLQEEAARQEHERLRQLIKGLLVYKEDLIIRLPTASESQDSCGGDDELAGPFRTCLEEDPAEAFLSFDEDLGIAAAHPANSGQRRIHSAPAQSTGNLLA